MRLVVFAGPTIDVATIRSFVDAVVEGPVSFGQVYRAGKQRPLGIVIVDGYFERVPAVWHKEILWAMSEGIHVFGCSSMGALRAAELADFGMIGIGAIFDAYRSGEFEDDDEVAVTHRQAADGYAPTSDALVNIRATLAHAVASGVIGVGLREMLLKLAKATFYAERNYSDLIRIAAERGEHLEQLAAFQRWLSSNRIDQKRADALTTLGYVADWCSRPQEPKRVGFSFHATDAWHQAMRMADARADEDARCNDHLAALTEELKLEGTYSTVWEGSALRGSAIREANRSGFCPDLVAVRGAFERLHDRVPSAAPEDFSAWSTRQGLTPGEALRFLEDEARAAWSTPLLEDLVRRHLVDYLRATGKYTRLIARINAKRKHLESFGDITPCLAELATSEHELWEWYFGVRRRQQVPSDIERYARNSGFRNVDELRSAVIRDFSFEVRSGGIGGEANRALASGSP